MIRPAGIDIGTSSIKLVELQERKGRIELLKCAMNSISGDDMKTSLKDLLAISGIGSRHVNISLSGPSVIVRYIEMPPMKQEELKSAIRFEGEKYIPFNVNEAIIDCAVLDKTPSGMSNRVLLVAAKKDRVKECMDVFKEVGLDVSAVDVDTVAVLNAFQRLNLEAKQEGVYAMINIGHRFSNMNVVTKGYPYFTRDIMLGGGDITNRIKESMGLAAIDQAEELKRNPGDKKDAVSSAIAPTLDKLISEVRLSLDYCEAQFGKTVEKLYLSGGGSYLFNIADFLKDSLGADVVLWNPLKGVDIAEGAIDKDIENHRAQFAVAMGLAMRK